MIQNAPKFSNWLLNLDEIDGADLPLVGGKAYRLAVLKQHGLNVPPGLVLTTQFFEKHLANNKLGPLWAGSPNIAVTAEALTWLADALKTKPLAKNLARALADQLTELFGPAIDQFAVRSSAIDEDQRDHTFAGIHLTELGVPRSAIPIAISRCWASALAGPAIQYRQDHGMSIQSIKIAVLIQPMLSPEYSGVGFTFNPVTGGRDEMIIETAVGLGKSVVSGEIQSHLYRVAYQPPQFPLLESRGSQASDPGPLSADVIRLLAAELQRVEALMGEPQDVEWAYQDEQIYLLQARPARAVTHTPPLPGQTWVRSQELAFLPEVPSPYWGHMLARSQPRIIKFLAGAGFDTRGADAYEKVLLGRPYLNLNLLKKMATQLGLTLLPDAPPASLIDLSLAGKINWQSVWQGRKIVRTGWQAVLKGQGFFDETRAQVEQIVAGLCSADESGGETPSTRLRQQISLFQQIAITRLRLNLALLLVSLSTKQVTGMNPGQFLATVVSPVDPDSREFDHALNFLVNLTRTSETLQQSLFDNANTYEDLASQANLPLEFQQQLHEVLDQFGNRGDFPADPGQPRYRDAPDSLLALLARRARVAAPPPEAPGAVVRPADWRLGVARPLIKSLQRLLLLRSDLEQLNIRAMAACRHWGLALGQKWHGQGWIARPDDIFWLTLDEIEQVLIAGETKAVSLSATVESRRAIFETYQDMRPPTTFREDNLASLQFGSDATSDATASVVVGLPVSPGQVRGTVVVLDQPNQPPLEMDDVILVMPSTGPDWLPLLHRAAGLIVETGGLLSHGSVIAREYEIPAVANIPQATRRYQSGDRVLVDGSTGVVQLLETTGAIRAAAEK